MATTVGYGSKLSVGDGVSLALVEIPYMVSITVPDAEAEVVESTHLASANRTREYIAGLVSPGNFGWLCRFDKTSYARILALKGLAKAFKIEWPDTSSATFSAIVTKAECEIGLDSVVDVKADARVSGPVTFTPAS